MPVNVYVGRQRSGKSYEVVSHVILGGLRDGRRVVSNIAGLDYSAMCELLLAEGIPIEQIGKLVCVTHEDIVKPSFFRTDKDEQAGFDSFIQPGDLLALDEVWRFWKKRGDLEPRAMNFIRMHGHMPHPETGFICEIALITQSIRDINENILPVVQNTFKMTKLTSVGMENRYRVDIYEGGTISRREYLRDFIRSYDSKYFPLYSSHSQKKQGAVDAVEKNADKRGNILQGALFKFVLPVGFVVFGFSVWSIYGFFHRDPGKSVDKTVSLKTSAPVATSALKVKLPTPDLSEEWRVAGYVSIGSDVVIYLADGLRSRLLYNPPNYKVHALEIETFLPSGEAVTGWTGKKTGLLEQSQAPK